MSTLRWTVPRFAAATLTLSLTTGCWVTKKQHEETVALLREEQAAHRATAEQLRVLEAQLAEAQTVLRRAQDHLKEQEQQLAQSQLDADVASTAREDAARLLDQLRGDLARVGDHLRAYSDQKNQLEAALDEAQAQAENLKKAEEQRTLLVNLMRDVSLALHDVVARKAATVRGREGNVVVSLKADRIFYGGKARRKMTREGTRWLSLLGAAVAPVERARLRVVEIPKTPDYPPEDLVVRLQSVSDVLGTAGVKAEHITLSLPEEGAGGAAPGHAALDSEGIAETESSSERRPQDEASSVRAKAPAGEPGTIAIVIELTPPPTKQPEKSKKAVPKEMPPNPA